MPANRFSSSSLASGFDASADYSLTKSRSIELPCLLSSCSTFMMLISCFGGSELIKPITSFERSSVGCWTVSYSTFFFDSST